MKPLLFGKYVLLDRIAVGGMAEVFLAKVFGVEGFERILAIKRILPNLAEDRDFVNMFVDEARIAVRLNHPNIVPIYELGKINEQYYIAMEYIAGQDMRRVLDRLCKAERKLPVAAAAFIVGQVCDGLDYAHHKDDANGRPLRVIHRDVSPQNVLLSYDGVVKVTDFGIATAESRVSEKTQAGVLKGKFGYMSPEQVAGEKIDFRSDIFAVGILLYEMVTGARLFVGKSDLATLERVRNADVPPPREADPSLPEDLERIMLKALARDPDERYQRAADLHDDLQRFLIVDNTIYNGKRLAAFVRGEYQQELERESARMEAFMQVRSPDSRQPALPPSPSSMPTASGIAMVAFTPDTVGSPAERTVIFESGQTQMNTPARPTRRATNETKPQRRPTRRHTVRGSKASPRQSRDTPPRGIRLPRDKRALAVVGSAAALVVMLTVFFSVLLGSDGACTVIVTSTPVRDVQIYLDGVLVAVRTPYTHHDLAVGQHTLMAKAAGYEPKAYRFVLTADEPTILSLELAQASNAEPVSPAVVVTATPAAANAVQTAPPPAESARTTSTAAVVALTGAPGAAPFEAGDDEAAAAAAAADVTPAPDSTDPATATSSATDQPEPTQDAAVAVASDHPGPAVVAANNTTELQVRSVPTGATLYYGAKNRGHTPVSLVVPANEKVVLGLITSGYEMTYQTVEPSGASQAVITVALKRRVIAPSGPAGGGTGPSAAPAACDGSTGIISLMAIGAQNCKVSIGGTSVGVAPFFKKQSPAGKCRIEVACDEDKRYSETRTLAPGVAEKVIIRPEMWR